MKPRIAIIGSGISGLGCAYALRQHADLVLFEKDNRHGGHVNSVEVDDPDTGRRYAVDSGFMVFRESTYPRVAALVRELGVRTKTTPVKVSITDEDTGVTYAIPRFCSMFSPRENLLRLRHWKLARRINRFHRDITADLDLPEAGQWTLLDYAIRKGYGEDFINRYLVPMTSAVWNTPPEQLLLFPASTLIRFLINHGFNDRTAVWSSIEGGASGYVRRLLEACSIPKESFRGEAVRVVRSAEGGVNVYTAEGLVEHFDSVVVATHADRALKLLHAPSARESELLGHFKYHDTVATMHHDEACMPRGRRCWAPWNCAIRRDANGRLSTSTHYWMNRLQSLDARRQFFVSLGDQSIINPDKVLRRFSYAHPLFTRDALRARPELDLLNHDTPGQPVYFCGSYFGHGFHEDALKSGQDVADVILSRAVL